MLNNQMVYIYIYLEVEVKDVEAMAHRNGSMTFKNVGIFEIFVSLPQGIICYIYICIYIYRLYTYIDIGNIHSGVFKAMIVYIYMEVS